MSAETEIITLKAKAERDLGYYLAAVPRLRAEWIVIVGLIALGVSFARWWV